MKNKKSYKLEPIVFGICVAILLIGFIIMLYSSIADFEIHNKHNGQSLMINFNN